MPDFKKDHISLLKILRNIITEELDNSSINPHVEEDVSEFLSIITDKRRARKLKSIRRELDKFIEEIIELNCQKKAIAEYHEQQRIKVEETRIARANEHQ